MQETSILPPKKVVAEKEETINPLKCDICGGEAVAIIKTGYKTRVDERADLFSCLSCGGRTQAIFKFYSRTTVAK